MFERYRYMEIKIIAINVEESYEQKEKYKPKIVNFEFDKKTTLLELREKLGIEKNSMSFYKYYNDLEFVQIGKNVLPYILINDRYYFDYNLDKVLIDDFINTHNIDLKSGICFEYGYLPCGGGGSLLDSVEWFSRIFTVLEIISTLEGVYAFTQRVKKIFKRKIPKPTTFQEIIYKRNLWNHFELSTKLGFSNEDTKSLLKAFGYKWNNNKKMYEITEREKNKRKK